MKKKKNIQNLIIYISFKIENMYFKDGRIPQKNSHAKILLSLDLNSHSICSRNKRTIFSIKSHICRWKTKSSSKFFSVNNHSWKRLHKNYCDILICSARRLSPAIVKFGPIRDSTCSSVLHVKIPKIIGVFWVILSDVMPCVTLSQT